jgi:hypothetical protein
MRKRIPYIETGTVKTKGIEVGTFVEKQMVWDLQKLMDEKGITNQDERDKMMMMWGAVFYTNRNKKHKYENILDAFAGYWKLI